MSPSYNLVNFALRPAKAVQRRMIIEICSRMNSFSNLLGFRYIGLGSPFFNDFASLHRRYGITNMVCIERETQDEKRFLFNKPYECIKMEWGSSCDVLPRLQWRNIPSMVWMDYDDPISEDILSDIGTIIGEIEPGSLVFFTLQAEGKAFDPRPESQNDSEYADVETEHETASEKRLKKLQDCVGDFLPPKTMPQDMNGKAFQRLLLTICWNEIERVLNQRNAGLPLANHVQYKQILNIIYSDGVRMTTFGGILYRSDQEQQFSECEFSDFDFVRDNQDPLEIKVPVLTNHEQLALSSKLPSGNDSQQLLRPVDWKAYRALYRYYPTFVETDL